MKLGLLADIHEHVERLRFALAAFAADRIDQIVVLGDVFQMGDQIVQVCESLLAADAVGCWGNHDYGLCVDPSPETIAKYPATVLDFMARLAPRLEMESCHFSHVEPWLDANNLTDLWYYDGPPDNPAAISRIFHAVVHDIIFVGHYHQWLLATPQGIDSWSGDEPFKLSEGQRYFIAVGALCDGHFGVFDTQTKWLVPMRTS